MLRLTQLRRQKSPPWPRVQLALLAHVSPEEVRHWEEGKSRPNRKQLQALADAVGYASNAAYLLEEVSTPTKARRGAVTSSTGHGHTTVATATIPLAGSDKVLTIDADMAEELGRYQWHADPRPNGIVYAYTTILSKTVWAHRAVLDNPKGIVHHISGDTLVCRRENLRVVSKAENAWLAGPQKGRRFVGVGRRTCRTTGRCWYARIESNRRVFCLGHYSTPEEAARARNTAARLLRGDTRTYLNDVTPRFGKLRISDGVLRRLNEEAMRLAAARRRDDRR